MAERIVVGPEISKGLKTDRLAFNIDNDAFPAMINANQFRGRVRRKRGTTLLNRAERYFDSTNLAYGISNLATAPYTITLSSGSGNLITGIWTDASNTYTFSLESTGNLVPGTIEIEDVTASIDYTDDSNGNLVGTPSGSGTINYATGAFTITGGASDKITAQFFYYPCLPALGFRDLNLASTDFPGNIAFDTTYSYNVTTSFPYELYDVSWYKDPVTGTSGLGSDYVQKIGASIIPTPVRWNGQNYQQFFTVNYEQAFWASNGVTVPFTTSNVGMQFVTITAMTINTVNTKPSKVTFTTGTNHGLIIGDFVFINEVIYSGAQPATSVNFQTGFVIAVPALNQVQVEFPNATLTGTRSNGGIIQYLTSQAAFPTKDCIRWYDGDPTNGSTSSPAFRGNFGWVNFCPPLSFGTYSIASLTADQYYLVSAKMIWVYKDRLLFLGPVIQSSTHGPFYLQDTLIWSQNGTPYYTCSFDGDPTLADTLFTPILTPNPSGLASLATTATPNAWWEDFTGYGGFLSAGISSPVSTVGNNEDALILGFGNRQTRLIYTSNDVSPFVLYSINTEFGSSSTFSTVTMDRGVFTVGQEGIVQASQHSAQRIDLEIPDSVFEFDLENNGIERVCAERDYVNEWIYWTYSNNNNVGIFPNETLFYNYREGTWGIFTESYSCYGVFRPISGKSWSNIHIPWEDWDEAWNAGSTTLLQPYVVGGTPQGFFMLRDNGTTSEDTSLYIQGFSTSTVTSPNHELNPGDFIYITGCLGSVGASVNNKVFQVGNITQDTFNLYPGIPSGLTYIGGGLIQRLYIPFIQTKQFPTSWQYARKTRLGPQQYLLTANPTTAQMTLVIYLSQNSNYPYNLPPIVPALGSINNSLEYSTVLYTCPELQNIGLTNPNINLQMPTAANQQQIWHRVNTSLIGDTIQVGFTLNFTQMMDQTLTNQFAEIELHGFVLQVSPSQLLA